MSCEKMVKDGNRIASLMAVDAADALMVCGMRLLLSVAVLLALYLNPDNTGMAGVCWFVLTAYTFQSLILYILSQFDQPSLHSGKMVYWLDVFWYTLIVLITGAHNSFFFLFFFFAILTSSFHLGFDEGARIALASTALFAGSALLVTTTAELPQILLRAVFLLALGYVIAYWGGLSVTQKRRLALLRDVSHLSNPRFGVDHTIVSVLEQTRNFFHADSCMLIMREAEADDWSLRTVRAAPCALHAERVAPATAALLLAPGQERLAIYTRARWPRLAWGGEAAILERGQTRWRAQAGAMGASLAELLEARSFISAPLPFRNGEGRVYVVCAQRALSKSDAQFLSHIGAQAFPVIENMALLDRLASGAAMRERQKIALDLHDTAIQPYIGLRHGLSALRNAAAADNPLLADLDKLIAMSSQVIGDMRHFARTFNAPQLQEEASLVLALRQQTAQFKQFYGIDIEVSVDGDLDVTDRLAAEVFQIVNEAMSNIRKHTSARRGCISLAQGARWLHIRIENEALAAPLTAFTPRSIAERCVALGGSAHVAEAARATVVQIAIPV